MKFDLAPKVDYNLFFFFFYIASFILGLVVLSWWQLIVAYFIFVFITTFGIGFGLHRVIIHRAATVPKFAERLGAIAGTLANQGSPITWGTSHYLHHINSDKDARNSSYEASIRQ